MKKVLGYTIHAVRNAQYVSDTRTVCVTVREYEEYDPAQELLRAAKRSDDSLLSVKKKVMRLKELGASIWLDTAFNSADIEFESQGCISENSWYTLRLNGMNFSESNIKLLARINKTIGDSRFGDNYLTKLITALKALKAIEVGYDSDMSRFYPVGEPSKLTVEALASVQVYQ